MATGATLSVFATVANERALQEARFYYKIRPVNTIQRSFQVSQVKETAWYTVKIAEKYCGCRAWQRSGLPCVHAARALLELDVGGDPAACTSEVYSCANWVATYVATVKPVAPEDEWVANDDHRIVVLPPFDAVRRSGHLQTKRIASRGMD